jgi:hypothetical protein
MIFIYFCGKPLARPQRQDEQAEGDIFPQVILLTLLSQDEPAHRQYLHLRNHLSINNLSLK